MSDPLELQHIRSFLAVVRLGSFTKAAGAVHRTQPAVTLAIQSLEMELAVKLFDRSARRVLLTPDGQRLLDVVSPLVEQWEALPSKLKETLQGIVTGPVRVGAGEGPVMYLLPPVLRAFKKQHPQVDVIVRNQPVEQTIEMLKTGELDFALRSLPAAPPGLEFRPIRTFDRMLITPKPHPVAPMRTLTLKTLSEQPFVMPWARSKTRRLVEDAFEKEGLHYRVAVEAGGWAMIKRYVAMGFGVSLVPSFCLEPHDEKAIAARSARSLFGQDTYGVLTKRGKVLSKTAQELLALLEQRLPGSRRLTAK